MVHKEGYTTEAVLLDTISEDKPLRTMLPAHKVVWCIIFLFIS